MANFSQKKANLAIRDYLLNNLFNFKLAFLSTYIPRKCGLATYTKDLTDRINVLNPYQRTQIIGIKETNREPVEYPWEVTYQIERNNKEDYLKVAEKLNQAGLDFVCIQHEYGIYGGSDGDYIFDLIDNLQIPIVTTFHTVLKNPTSHQKEILQKIAAASMVCIVMIEEAAHWLEEVYGVAKNEIVVIPHGVVNTPYSPANFYKEKAGFKKEDFLFGCINLISENKGLEYVIKALPEVIKEIPNAKFLMVGQTHPMVKLNEGEIYREKLKKLAHELKVEDHIIEMNHYISLDELIRLLQAMDIYITPYLDMAQTASGTLAYAIGAGKVCISTPYIYACAVLSDNRGILINEKDEHSLASAIIKVYKEPAFAEELSKNAYKYGRTMIWPRVALEYLNIFAYIKGHLNS